MKQKIVSLLAKKRQLKTTAPAHKHEKKSITTRLFNNSQDITCPQTGRPDIVA